jgi:hypothetical protein
MDLDYSRFPFRNLDWLLGAEFLCNCPRLRRPGEARQVSSLLLIASQDAVLKAEHRCRQQLLQIFAKEL